MKKYLVLLISIIQILNISPIIADTPAIKVKGKPYPITEGALSFMNPQWSPDGTMIAFTENKYVGIWVLNLKTNSYVQVTDEIGAGFGFQWSADSKKILCRVSKYENNRRYNAIKVFNLETGKSQLLSDYRTLMTGLPRWEDGGTKVYLYSNKGLEFFTLKGQQNINAKFNNISTRKKIFYTNDKGIYIFENQKSIKLSQPINGQCLNERLSPDGTKLAFELYGGTMYVLDLLTNELTDLGVGNKPEWAPDSKKLVYMITEDDGHQFTRSDIYVINCNGSGKINLTNSEALLEMNPSWSPDGKKIVFDEMLSGKIYILEVRKTSPIKFKR